MSKAILYILGNDIQLAAGVIRTCAGHEAGSRAAIHAMSTIFKDDDTDAILLVDATNAFNQLNCEAACIIFLFFLSIFFCHLEKHLWSTS